MKNELSHVFRGLQDMENYIIKDVLICSVGNNCSLHEISRTENVTFPEDKELLSKLNKWEDYIVATYLLTVGKFIFFILRKSVKRNQFEICTAWCIQLSCLK